MNPGNSSESQRKKFPALDCILYFKQKFMAPITCFLSALLLLSTGSYSNTLPEAKTCNQITTDTTPVKASRLIVPGKSIGRTTINQTFEAVIKQLGEPANGDASMGGHSTSNWYSKPVIHGKDTIIYETNVDFYTKNFGEENSVILVAHIRVTSPYFMTAKHVGVGSSLKTIKKYYPAAVKMSSDTDPGAGKQTDTYTDEKKGIEFEVSGGKCVAVKVYGEN